MISLNLDYLTTTITSLIIKLLKCKILKNNLLMVYKSTFHRQEGHALLQWVPWSIIEQEKIKTMIPGL